MQDRHQHQPEVQAFLRAQLGSADWDFELPVGTGHETYIAHSHNITCFVKLGAQVARYQTMSTLALTPQVLAAGTLTDGTSIMVQPFIEGRQLRRKDYRDHLERIAATIDRTHHSAELQSLLPSAASDHFSAAGLEVLSGIQRRWERYRPQVPAVADFVDQSLASLAERIAGFQGTGLVASHNDICNANWLITDAGQLYLIDLEAMTLDDPALDIGATLWWYYQPPQWASVPGSCRLRADESFRERMQVRMALHCLNITLPREHSFDQFDAASYPEYLTDFRAMLAGEPNPEINED